MPNLYSLCLEDIEGDLVIAQGKDKKQIIAQEGDQYLLREMGDSLLSAGLINGYQLMISVGYPKRKGE